MYKDEHYKGIISISVAISFSADKVYTTQAKGFPAQSYTILSVSAKHGKQTAKQQDYTYNLKDTNGHSVLLLATMYPRTKDFQFDFFKGQDDRITFISKAVNWIVR